MCVCVSVCLAVWYFLKEFPPTVRAEPPWAPQQSNPQTDPVLLPERNRDMVAVCSQIVYEGERI